MNTQQVADRLVELCKKGDFKTAQQELYAEDVISIEPMETPDYARETKGKDAVLEKIQKFENSIDTVYGNEVSTALVTANAISFILTMDVAMKGKDRMKMEEICVYEVKDGKVISERFFM